MRKSKTLKTTYDIVLTVLWVVSATVCVMCHRLQQTCNYRVHAIWNVHLALHDFSPSWSIRIYFLTLWLLGITYGCMNIIIRGCSMIDVLFKKNATNIGDSLKTRKSMIPFSRMWQYPPKNLNEHFLRNWI